MRERGELTLTNVDLVEGYASEGGCVRSQGALRLSNCSVSRCAAAEASGGGVWSSGAVTAVNVTFARNTASETGGALFSRGELSLSRVLFESNAGALGGDDVSVSSPRRSLAKIGASSDAADVLQMLLTDERLLSRTAFAVASASAAVLAALAFLVVSSTRRTRRDSSVGRDSSSSCSSDYSGEGWQHAAAEEEEDAIAQVSWSSFSSSSSLESVLGLPKWSWRSHLSSPLSACESDPTHLQQHKTRALLALSRSQERVVSFSAAAEAARVLALATHSPYAVLDEKRVAFKEEIGRGSFGVVRRCLVQLEGLGTVECAAKTALPQSPRVRARLFDKARSEIEVLATLRHPNVLRLLGAAHLQHLGLALIVELAAQGSHIERRLAYIDPQYRFMSKLTKNREI